MEKYLLVIQNIISKKVYSYSVTDIGVKDYLQFELELKGDEDDGEYTYYLLKDNGYTIRYFNDNIKDSKVVITGTPVAYKNKPLLFYNQMLIVDGDQEIAFEEFNPIKKGLLVVGDYINNNVQYKVNDGKTTYKQYNG